MVKISNVPRRNEELRNSLIKKTVLAFAVVWIISNAFHSLNHKKTNSILSNDHNDNNNRCLLVYGTAWKKEKTAELVEKAIENGFRCIDTASQVKHYNEKGVGKGVLKSAQSHRSQKFVIYLVYCFCFVCNHRLHI